MWLNYQLCCHIRLIPTLIGQTVNCKWICIQTCARISRTGFDALSCCRHPVPFPFMSRYLPPSPKSSPYITREGFDRLKLEEKVLWQRRKEVTAALSAAAAEGDRSENAEYIYRKKELREIDRRVRYLQKRIPDLKVVERQAGGRAIYFGAEVELECEATMSTVRIVGSDEIDPARKHISIDSPLARALLKKEVDDEVSIEVEGRVRCYAVLAIRYTG